MPQLTRLQSADYMAMTRAMDQNGNHKVDQNEANIGRNTHNKIGNQNGVAGTRETATALENGDVFLTGVNAATADKIADYFSKREDNFDKPVAQWVSDAWISKADFDFDPQAKAAIDVNRDNRVSSKEFAAALVSGVLTIGEARQVSQDPFQKPGSGHGNDPFQKPGSGQGNDPFQKPGYGQGNDPFQKPGNNQGNDPFQKPGYGSSIPDSGAYLQIEMTRSMRSDYEKTQLLTDLASKPNLSPREQEMLAEAAVKNVSSDFSQGQILTALANNSNLHEEGAIKVLKAARELSDYSRSQLLDTVISNHKLGPKAQQSAIITATTMSGYNQTQSLLGIISKQNLAPQNKEFLMDQVRQHVSSDYDKRQIMDALF